MAALVSRQTAISVLVLDKNSLSLSAEVRVLLRHPILTAGRVWNFLRVLLTSLPQSTRPPQLPALHALRGSGFVPILFVRNFRPRP